MPLQNRVTPFGDIVADPARGLMMGNRGGQLHDAERQLGRRRWASRQWISCVLDYKGRRQEVMAPRHYTQLFFLDEATALAAGHRPCALCRRAEFQRFMALWQQVHGLKAKPKAAEVDAVLHAERVGPKHSKRVYEARFADLPDRVLAAPLGSLDEAYLRQGCGLRVWTPAGYGAIVPVHPGQRLAVLTPPSIVALIAAGYAPLLHESARSTSVARSV